MKAFGTLQSIRSPLRAVDGNGTYDRSISSILTAQCVPLSTRRLFSLSARRSIYSWPTNDLVSIDINVAKWCFHKALDIEVG
jgi:hypothetical protein